MAFWPRFYWGILTSSNRRSFRDTFMDPCCQQSQLAGRSPVSRLTRRRFLARNIIRIQPMQCSLGCILHYKVRGAFAKIGAAASPEVVETVDLAMRRVYFDDPLRISVPYSFFRKRMGRPPDNAFTRFLAIVGIILLYASVIRYRFYLLHHQEGRNPAFTSAVPTPHVALTLSMDVCQECLGMVQA